MRKNMLSRKHAASVALVALGFETAHAADGAFRSASLLKACSLGRCHEGD